MKSLALLLLVCLAGCAKQEGEQTTALQEAVFRYQFAHNASIGQQSHHVWFLAFGDPHEEGAIDPPKEFMTRFSDLPRIGRLSESGRSDSGWVIDAKTKEPGVIFFVHDVRLTGPDSAVARGGYQQDKLSASGNTYMLKFGWRGWRVTGATLDWISKRGPDKRPKPMSVRHTAMAHHRTLDDGRFMMGEAEAFARVAGCGTFIANAAAEALPFYSKLGSVLDPGSPESNPHRPRMRKD